ncbi:MAG: anthranilate synthase component [Pyrinomonadaceae bacterium]|jgi:anthranilate synthase/aminodeoxychorismate synthase-like glutamine amidotransferase|nr:anthranilate synthase component [Pyrinomonadaceae bacterium]
MILVIDNYDSFTYNLVQYLGELGADVVVRRNDRVSIEEIATQLRPERIVISPGPGVPDDAGMTLKLIENFATKLPILGVCLGHQAIGQHFGGRVVRAERCVHGKASAVSNDGRTVFKGIANPFKAARYHSLVIDPKSLPECLEVSAVTADGVVMGIRHRQLKVEGVQFHPESILTTAGKRLLENFLNL